VIAAIVGAGGREWKLSEVHFYCQGVVGTMMLDTGTSATTVTLDFATRAGLEVRDGPRQRVRMGDGRDCPIVGVTDISLTLQLMIDIDDDPTGRNNASLVHWDRYVTLRDVWVADLGPSPPRDVFVSYADWAYDARQPEPAAPLASLAWIIQRGARLIDSPRPPAVPGSLPVLNVVAYDPGVEARAAAGAGVVNSLTAGGAGLKHSTGNTARGEAPLAVAGAGAPPVLAALTAVDVSLPDAIRSRISDEYRTSPLADRLLAALDPHARVFSELNPAECTETVEFALLDDSKLPPEVTFAVPASRKAGIGAYRETLDSWSRRHLIERVPWDSPAYGFAIIVPKPNGKWRVTINPAGINRATQRISPEGGFMPPSMVLEAQRPGNKKLAVQLDLAEAFVSMKLGPLAQRLSTFTTPLGKYRWKHGFFGWHSFPAAFQRLIMTKVVLPLMDEFPGVTVLAWIDDLVLAADTDDELLAATVRAVELILAFGGRLSLHKCQFFVKRFDWCGLEVDLPTRSWRIAPARVADLSATPIPKDGEALSHVLGTIRYYFHGVKDHKAQRAYLAKLSELDVKGVNMAREWTAEHTEAMRAAIAAVVSGDWLLVYDPTQRVHVTTDASGKHGYCVTAHQYDRQTGKMRPIAYISKPWLAEQLQWKPQVKECYAQMQAVTNVMRAYYPFAEVTLLCDNRNLSGKADSEDARVIRWQFEILCSGCIVRYWIPGFWNTIADYGSRVVEAVPDATLTEEERFELHIYAMLGGGGARTERAPPTARDDARAGAVASSHGSEDAARAGPVASPSGPASAGAGTVAGATTVPGHLHMAPMVRQIIEAQLAAPAAERLTWRGTHYSTATLGGLEMVLFRGRLLVPTEATQLKQALLRLAHDDNAHYTGAERTVQQLQVQARVHWMGLAADVQRYIDSCFQCQFAKTDMGAKSAIGELAPTVAPYVDHTWYIDCKGPMPGKTGYLLAVVESISRMVKLRYVPRITAKEVMEELEEIITSFGTLPAVLRSDCGQPFESAEFLSWCEAAGIEHVPGIPYHSQGQGMVESRFRPLAASIIAVLGHKAPTDWWKSSAFLALLEFIVNSTYCESLRGCPYWVRHGREPRTRLMALADWNASAATGRPLTGLGSGTWTDIEDLVVRHHAGIDAVQQRALIATSVAQAHTKRDWDASRTPGDFAAGDHVVLRRIAPDKLQPYRTGPYRVGQVSADGNLLTAAHYIDGSVVGPLHVSRVVRFDATRATKADIAAFQCEEGSFVIDEVIEHRQLDGNALELHIRWRGTPLTTWQAAHSIQKVKIVRDYCDARGLSVSATDTPTPSASGGGGKTRRGTRSNGTR